VLSNTHSVASTFTGTPFYMSPEVMHNSCYNTKSDMWSAGCIIVEMCTLERAFYSTSLLGLMHRICTGPTPKIPDSYSDNLQELVSALLNKSPEDRPDAQQALYSPFVRRCMDDAIRALSHARSRDIRKDRMAIADAVKSVNAPLQWKKSSAGHTSASSSDSIGVADISAGDRQNVDRRTPVAAAKASSPQSPRSSSPAKPARKGADQAAKPITPREQAEIRKRQQADDRAAELASASRVLHQPRSDKERKVMEQRSKVFPWMQDHEESPVSGSLRAEMKRLGMDSPTNDPLGMSQSVQFVGGGSGIASMSGSFYMPRSPSREVPAGGVLGPPRVGTPTGGIRAVTPSGQQRTGAGVLVPVPPSHSGHALEMIDRGPAAMRAMDKSGREVRGGDLDVNYGGGSSDEDNGPVLELRKAPERSQRDRSGSTSTTDSRTLVRTSADGKRQVVAPRRHVRKPAASASSSAESGIPSDDELAESFYSQEAFDSDNSTDNELNESHESDDAVCSM
jgi:hypothetical protein